MKISKERFNRMNKDFPNMKFYKVSDSIYIHFPKILYVLKHLFKFILSILGFPIFIILSALSGWWEGILETPYYFSNFVNEHFTRLSPVMIIKIEDNKEE